MLKPLVVATTNPGKLQEFKALLSPLQGYEIFGLSELVPEVEEVAESHSDYFGNARAKALYWYQRLGVMVLADDSGLEVECLDGWPGVHSARIASDDVSRQEMVIARIRALGYAAAGKEGAHARFVCVICVVGPECRYFEGVLNGEIRSYACGSGGFGYDPVFFLRDGRALAELSLYEKCRVSHRALAVQKLLTCFAQEPVIKSGQLGS